MADTRPPKNLGDYDFYSPFFTAAVVAQSGNRYPLTVAAESGNKLSVGGASALKLTGLTASGAETTELTYLPFLTEVTVEMEMGFIPIISATLNPPFELARKMIDTEAVEFMSSTLEVTFGYSAGRGNSTQLAVSPTFMGLITKPDISLGADITIALNAQGTGGYRLVATNLSEHLPKASLRSHIETLCQRLGVFATFTQLDQTSSTLLAQEESLTINNSSYLAIIYDIARRCGCYVMQDATSGAASGNGESAAISIVSMSQIMQNAPVANLRLFDGLKTIGPSTGDYPILSVSTQHNGIFLSAMAKTIIRKGMDQKTGETVRQETSPSKTPTKTASKGALGKPDDSTKVSRTADPAAADKPKALQEAEAAVQALSTSGGGAGIQLEVETLGFPDILPGQKVKVIGVSQRIDDDYAVFKVKHQLSGSGYQTSLTLVQNSNRLWEDVRKTIKSLNPSPYTTPAPDPAKNALGDGPQTAVTPKVQ